MTPAQRISEHLADHDREAELLANLLALADHFSGEDTRSIVAEVIGDGTEKLCHDEFHQSVWTWIRAIHAAGRAPAFRNAQNATELQHVPDHVWNRLEQPGEGAIDLVTEVRELTEIAQRRSATQTMYRAIQDLQRGAQVRTINQVALTLGQISSNTSRSRTADEFADAVEYDKARRQGSIPGIPTGIPSLDVLLDGGFKKGQLVLFVASTGHGKTRWALGMTASCLKAGFGVTYASQEQGETSPWQDSVTGQERRSHRVAVGLQRISYGVGRVYRGTPENLMRLRAGLELITRRNPDGNALLHLYSDDMSIAALEAEATRAALRGHHVLVVDNLEHVEGRHRKGENEAAFLKAVAMDLQRIATRTGLVVVVLVQPMLNEKTLTAERPPRLYEIADSKAISRPADYVISAYRKAQEQKQDYKASVSNAPDESDLGRWGTAQFSVEKARDEGIGGQLTVGWDEHVGRYFDLHQPDLPLPGEFINRIKQEERAAAEPLFSGGDA